ncbi:hypothetical protein niasHT_024326 [Heterodera trifolii]|uniref:Uncharacterized protein n=1 Tax=Heterodera trifolii TaxID=157864 RepID=A0ABD2JM97_9BILA
MLYDRRPCQPFCRAPDKRDFMEYEPAKTANDFYKSYDPMVGVGTAAILLLFIALLTAKSFLRWTIKQWRMRKYIRRREKQQQKAAKKLVTIVGEANELTKPSQPIEQQKHPPNGNIV